jgi:hypothetical protein
VLPLTRDAFRLVSALGHGKWFLGEPAEAVWLNQLPHTGEAQRANLPPV